MDKDPESVGSVFIDFDNVLVALMNLYSHSKAEAQAKTLQTVGQVDQFLEEERGIQVIKRRGFCDWSQYPDAMGELYNMGVQPIHVKGVPGKNSADMELSLSVQEDVLKRNDIDAFVIVAGDRDYMPITNRVKELNKALYFVSFKETLSGDLRTLVGEDAVFYIDPKTGSIMGSDWTPQATRPRPGRISVARGSTSGELTEDESKALQAAIRFYDENHPKYDTVKTGVFLVTGLADELRHLRHVERRTVLNSLTRKRLVKTELGVTSWGEQFSAFTIDEDSPIVKKIRAQMSRG